LASYLLTQREKQGLGIHHEVDGTGEFDCSGKAFSSG
jgi:hypothetical protein